MRYDETKAGRARTAEMQARNLGWNDVADMYRKANHAYECGQYKKGDALMRAAYDAETPLVQKALK